MLIILNTFSINCVQHMPFNFFISRLHFCTNSITFCKKNQLLQNIKRLYLGSKAFLLAQKRKCLGPKAFLHVRKSKRLGIFSTCMCRNENVSVRNYSCMRRDQIEPSETISARAEVKSNPPKAFLHVQEWKRREISHHYERLSSI